MEITARVIVSSAALKGQAPEIVRERLKAAMSDACAFGKRKIQLRTPRGASARAGLMSSIQFETRPTATGRIGIIGTANPYGLVVEMGRRPGMGKPPIGALVPWIKMKLGVSEEEAERIQFPMRNKIARDGTEPVEMFAKLLTDDRAALDAIFQRHGFKLATELAAP